MKFVKFRKLQKCVVIMTIKTPREGAVHNSPIDFRWHPPYNQASLIKGVGKMCYNIFFFSLSVLTKNKK